MTAANHNVAGCVMPNIATPHVKWNAGPAMGGMWQKPPGWLMPGSSAVWEWFSSDVQISPFNKFKCHTPAEENHCEPRASFHEAPAGIVKKTVPPLWRNEPEMPDGFYKDGIALSGRACPDE